MGYVRPPCVAVTGPSKVGGFDAVARGVAHQRRSHKEIVGIKMPARPVVVVVIAELRCITFPKGILAEKVGDEHDLVPELAAIQFTVRVFLQHVEAGGVELITIASVIAEEPDSQVNVTEDEPSEIADEGLDARANGGRIEIGTFTLSAAAPAQERQKSGCISQPNLGKRILEGNIAVGSRVAAAYINVDDTVFLSVEIIEVEVRRYVDSIVDWLKSRVSVTVVQRETNVLPEKELTASAEEFGAVGILTADVTRNRQTPRVDKSLAFGSYVEKIMLAEERVITLPDVLAIRIQTPSFFEPRIVREADAPAVGNRNEIRGGLGGARDARCAGIA